MNKNNEKELEIEKKFLVDSIEEVRKIVDLDKCKIVYIEQGYLCNNPTIRVRKFNEEYCITYKARINKDRDNDVIVNHEVELPITEEAYYKLIKKIDYNVVKKTRYKIPLEKDLVAELDVFEEKLEGLIMVEVEFDNEKDAMQFKPPKWFKKDVSSDIRFKNLYLAQIEEYNLMN